MKLDELTNPIIVCSYCGHEPADGLYHHRAGRKPWLSPLCFPCASLGQPEQQRYGDMPQVERGEPNGG